MNQTQVQPESPGSRGIAALAEAMRPHHWVKNVFVLAPLLFSGLFDDLGKWIDCLTVVAGFCLLSSSVYLYNDVCDRNEDRAHPVKRNRPIASGRISPGLAIGWAIVLLIGGLGLVAKVQLEVRSADLPLGGLGLSVWTLGYVILNLLYSCWLKHHAIVDVLAVAFGFVLRAMAGAAAIAVPISPWLVVCTLTLCLFIALAKRRSEIAEMPEGEASSARKAHAGYHKLTIEHMLTVSASLAILTYSLYCLAPRTVNRIGSSHMVWTIPLVIYGTFRYYRTTHWTKMSDPLRVLVTDKIMWLVVILYAVLSALIIKFGSHESIRTILGV